MVDDVDLDQAEFVELGVVAAEVRCGHAVHVADVDRRGNRQRLVKRADLDARAPQIDARNGLAVEIAHDVPYELPDGQSDSLAGARHVVFHGVGVGSAVLRAPAAEDRSVTRRLGSMPPGVRQVNS